MRTKFDIYGFIVEYSCKLPVYSFIFIYIFCFALIDEMYTNIQLKLINILQNAVTNYQGLLATEVNFWVGLQRIDSEWKWTDHSKVNKSIVYVYTQYSSATSKQTLKQYYMYYFLCFDNSVISGYYHLSYVFESHSWRVVLDTTLCEKVCH